MAIVQIKGSNQKVRFPNDMIEDQMLTALRSQYPRTLNQNIGDALGKPESTISNRDVSLAENTKQKIANFLFDNKIVSDRYGAQRIGDNLSSLLGVLPGIGDAQAGDEFGKAVAEGDGLGVGVGLLSAIPLLGSLAKPAAQGVSPALKSLINASKETLPEVISSRLGRAQSQGFNVDNVVFHGTPADFKEFDPKLSGAKGDDFGEAIYFSDDPGIASGFSVSLTKNKEFQDVINEAEKAKANMASIVKSNGVNSQEFKAIKNKISEIDSRRSVLYDSINKFKSPTTGSNVRPAILKGNFTKFDANGKHYSQVNKEAVAIAKSQGADGVIISNSVDAGTTESTKASTISIVFKPENIRSIFDEFKEVKKVQNKSNQFNK
jgi:hypothetical protein